MGKVNNNQPDINTIAEQLLKQYRDIPSLDKSQKLLSSKYGPEHFGEIRKRFAQLWLKESGFEVKEEKVEKVEKVEKKAAKKAKKKSKLSGWKTPLVVKKEVAVAIPKKKPVAISRPNVPVPDIMRDIRGSKVVTTCVDPEAKLPPVSVSLPVIRTSTFGGKLCYVVNYGPNGVEPYEWHVPVVDSIYENLNQIPCIYHNHTLVFDANDPSLAMIKRSPVRMGPRPRVTTITRPSAPRSFSAGSVQPEPSPSPIIIKRPERWRGLVGADGKHKCGKPFICNCCGQSFSKNQGYRINYKEIYFCFGCSKEIFKRSNRGWSGVIISTPMGNKR